MSEPHRPRAAASWTGAGAASDPAAAGTETAADGTSFCPVAFCPICAAVSAAQRSGPEVVQHLLLAGQQFFLALRAVIDARAADFDGGDSEEPPTMERIDIG